MDRHHRPIVTTGCWMRKPKKLFRCGQGCWCLRLFPCRCHQRGISKLQLQRMLWPTNRWQVWAVQPSLPMGWLCGFNSKSPWNWAGEHIAAWELLAQFALTHCIESRLSRCRGPVSCHQGTHNSAADAASAKGLSMTSAMATVLSPFFTFMRRFEIFLSVTHIPGHLHVIADSLSRLKQRQHL